jgi:hypothetical protein
VVIDNSTVDDSHPADSELALYKAAFTSVANLAPTGPLWVAMHRPIWAISVPPGSTPGHSKTLAAAAKGSLPPNLQTFISGHLHTFQVTSYVEDLPIQIVSGTGGSQLSTPGVSEVVGTSVGGVTVKAGVGKPDIFGFSILERSPNDSASSWSITGYDIRTRVLARCELQNRNVACE